MLTEKFGPAYVKEHLSSHDKWHPFPTASERDTWKNLFDHELNRRRRDWLIPRAEKLVGKPWPQLPATLIIEFMRSGNRRCYEDPYFTRRGNLGKLVMAECMEGKGRFTDEIINGIWLICDESTWSVPAHEGRRDTTPYEEPLPDTEDPTVDLFSCETAMVLAETVYLLREQLDAVSPQVALRVRRLTEQRIFAPVEAKKFHWWYQGLNNWNPWCSSNILGAAMYWIEDQDRLAKMAYLLMGYVDNFIGHYAPDGGCSEGPGYWNAAGGAMLEFLELLYERSGGQINVYNEPLIKEMGLYLPRVYLDGPWFTNFSDAGPRIFPKRGTVYRYGERVNSPEMQEVALLSMRGWNPDAPVDPPFGAMGIGKDINLMLRELFWIPVEAKPRHLPRFRTVWMPNLQVMVARESEAAGKGMILAAKAGHNDECHNHNDVGQFIVMHDGEPFVVDAGVQTYVRGTFDNSIRYGMWHARSSGHNVPVINGSEQMYGKEYAARDVRFADDGQVRRLILDMAGTYPEDAGITRAERTVMLDKENIVTVTDRVAVQTGPVAVELTLLTPRQCSHPEPGTVRLQGEHGSLVLQYDPAAVSTELETFVLEDLRMTQSWGESLQKIIFKCTSDTGECTYTIRIEPEV